MEDHGVAFDIALAVTRAGNVFTTHTPIEAAFDRFSREMMEKYFVNYAEQRLHISMDALMGMGRKSPFDPSEPFNMAYLAIRGSGSINGVSRLHGAVSRNLSRDLFPRWPEPEVPIQHVTNGVHVPTWDSAEADALWARACGEERWRGSLEYVEEQIRCVTDEELWDMRSKSRTGLVAFVRDRLANQRASPGASAQEIEDARRVFSESHLTLGFARRFAPYKRPNMLLHDPERLMRFLTNPERPVQLVLAGKTHPRDTVGEAMIRQWNEFIRRSEVGKHVVFLADHDMLLSERLIDGVDVWINTPRRPSEASGTSGMKVLANGGLNLSELDGWWAEAYAPDVGWAIGDGRDRGDDSAWDVAETGTLLNLLEKEIIPGFYDRDVRGIPRQWVARIRESMARLTPAFSANRTVRQYSEERYIPSATAYCERAERGGQAGAELLGRQRAPTEYWPDLYFGPVSAIPQNGMYSCDVYVHLRRIDPGDISVEIYADPLNDEPPIRRLMTCTSQQDSDGYRRYSALVPANRPAEHYTPRAVPSEAVGFVPLELPLITWQK